MTSNTPELRDFILISSRFDSGHGPSMICSKIKELKKTARKIHTSLLEHLISRLKIITQPAPELKEKQYERKKTIDNI